MSSSCRDDDDEILLRVDDHHEETQTTQQTSSSCSSSYQTQTQTTQKTSSSSSSSCNRSCSWFSQLLSIFLKSLRIIFLENPRTFLSIYLLTCLPLSVLLTCQSLSTRRLKSHIHRLEWVARAAEVWVEADNVLDESRHDLRVLFRHKALFAVPVFLLSLASLSAAVSTAAGTTRRPVIAPAITCVVGYAVQVAGAWVARAAAATVAAAAAAVGVAGVKAVAVEEVVVGVAEVYVMAVVSVGMVVSVAEERAGVEAMRAGWGVMRVGRRAVTGWVLSGVVLAGSACIGREVAGVMDGGDWGVEWTARMRYGYMGGLVMMMGWWVLWSYVGFTVFYCEWRKKNKRGYCSSANSSGSGFSATELEEY